MEDEIIRIAKKYKDSYDFFFIGRGFSYPTALEGALKLKEITYIHGEGYAAGELKHGPLALIDDDVPVLAVVPPGDSHDKTLSPDGAAVGGEHDRGESTQPACDGLQQRLDERPTPQHPGHGPGNGWTTTTTIIMPAAAAAAVERHGGSTSGGLQDQWHPERPARPGFDHSQHAQQLRNWRVKFLMDLS